MIWSNSQVIKKNVKSNNVFVKVYRLTEEKLSETGPSVYDKCIVYFDLTNLLLQFWKDILTIMTNMMSQLCRYDS